MSLKLETERLIMRCMQPEDAEHMFDLNSDPDVIRYTGDKPFNNVEEALNLILNYDQYSKYRMGRLNMFLKSTGEYIGWCGLKYHQDSGETDIGYRLKKSCWGYGYATESGKASLAYGFSDLGLPSIVGHALKENTASIRVLEKLGLKYMQDTEFDDEPGVLYKITQTEWK